MTKNRYGISDLIEMELSSAEPNVWFIDRLKRRAQQEFNTVVETQGAYLSPYQDINELYNGYADLSKQHFNLDFPLLPKPTTQPENRRGHAVAVPYDCDIGRIAKHVEHHEFN